MIWDDDDLEKQFDRSPIVVFYRLASEDKLYQPCLDMAVDNEVNEVAEKATMLQIMATHQLLGRMLESISDEDMRRISLNGGDIDLGLANLMKEILEKAMMRKSQGMHGM